MVDEFRDQGVPGERPIDWTDPKQVADCVERHRVRLLAFVEQRMSLRLRQRIDPEDILQEVCLTAVRATAPDGGIAVKAPYGWLCHVAEQRIIDAHRRFFEADRRSGNREVSIDAPAQPGSDGGGLGSLIAVSMTTPSAAMSRDARESRLRRAIDMLPEDQRQVVRLRYVDGLATRDIAIQLGRSDVSVRVMLSRTIKKLQQSLANG